MASLYELINAELEKNKSITYNRLDEFITDDKRSAEFIMSLSEGLKFSMPDESTELYRVAQSRARHSAIVCLFGQLIISNITGFNAESKREELFDNIWLLAALNHDIGYTLKGLINASIDYKKEFRYYLLQDQYNTDELQVLNDFSKRYGQYFAYTYEEIESYDQYARNYHSKNPDDVEKVDHGILGGVYLFNQKIGRCIKDSKPAADYIITKAAAITVAQHNLYKSPNEKIDKFYPADLKKLHSTSTFRISKETPVLLLLSLIDTVDCVKRFSKKNTPGSSLESISVLKGIDVTFDNNSAVISFQELSNRIAAKEKELAKKGGSGTGIRKILDDHMRGVMSLNDWTTYKVERVGDYEFRLEVEV